jgi:hypothetical protein
MLRDFVRIGAGPAELVAIHDGVKVGLDGIGAGGPDLVEDVSDLVGPAPLDGNAVKSRRQLSQQALTRSPAALAGEASAVEIGQEALPFGAALARRQAEVDDSFFARRSGCRAPPEPANAAPRAGVVNEHDPRSSMSAL